MESLIHINLSAVFITLINVGAWTVIIMLISRYLKKRKAKQGEQLK